MLDLEVAIPDNAFGVVRLQGDRTLPDAASSGYSGRFRVIYDDFAVNACYDVLALNGNLHSVPLVVFHPCIVILDHAPQAAIFNRVTVSAVDLDLIPLAWPGLLVSRVEVDARIGARLRHDFTREVEVLVFTDGKQVCPIATDNDHSVFYREVAVFAGLPTCKVDLDKANKVILCTNNKLCQNRVPAVDKLNGQWN